MHPISESDTNSAPLLPTSSLNIIIKVSRIELNNLLNKIITQSFSEGFTIDEGYKIQSKISGPVEMQTLNNSIISSIPLQIDITPSGIFNQIKIKGQIEIQLATQLDIFQDSLLIKTELRSHRWLSKPVLNVLGINISIEQIANRIVKKYKNDVCENIDKTIINNIDLNDIKKSTLRYFEKPLYSTDDSIIHVFASPLEFALGPMSMSLQELIIPVTIYFECVIAELKPTDLNNNPNFSIRPYLEPISNFSIQSRLPLNYIEQIVRENVENQTFGSGITKVTIKKIAMHGSGSTFQLNLDLTGAFNGLMNLSFEPYYEKSSQEVKIKNLELKVIKGPKMEKIIFSLIKSIAENKLRNTIEDQINSNLESYIANISKLLTGTEILQGVFINGTLNNYEIKDIRHFNNRMYFYIASQLTMEAQVKNLNGVNLNFNKF